MKYHLHRTHILNHANRRWCYEVFVHLHIVGGIGYVGLLFWHCGNMLTSVCNPPPKSSLCFAIN